MSQLDLRARLPAAGTSRENVENEAAAIEDADADQFFEITRLRRRKVVVEHHERRAVILRHRPDLFRFAAADEALRIGFRPLREDLLHDRSSGTLDQFREFFEVFFSDASRQLRQDQSGGDDFLEH